MALFRFRKKNVNPANSSILRKTQSTGNIIENTIVVTTTTERPAAPTNEPADRMKQEPLKSTTGNSNSTHSHSAEQDCIDDSNNSSEDDDDVKSVSSLPAPTTTMKASKSEYPSQHMLIPRGEIVKSNSTPSTPRKMAKGTNSYFSSNDLELLLSEETEARIEAQEKKAAEEVKPIRQTRLKFELPETPSRSRSPAYSAYSRPRQRWSMPDEKVFQNQQQNTQKKKVPRKSKWTKIMGGESSDDDDSEEPRRTFAVGDKVRLLHRPLPILGYIRYMGPVDFAQGDDWVGVELDSRVGKNDGQVDGKRYFQTDPHRGIFLKKSEVGVV